MELSQEEIDFYISILKKYSETKEKTECEHEFE